MKKILFVVFIATFSAFSYAEFYTGNDLKRMCVGQVYEDAICMGYVTGIYDTLVATNAQNGICTGSGGVTVGQIQEITKKYFNEHPEKLHFTAQFLVRSALREAFPCPRK